MYFAYKFIALNQIHCAYLYIALVYICSVVIFGQSPANLSVHFTEQLPKLKRLRTTLRIITYGWKKRTESRKLQDSKKKRNRKRLPSE